MLKRSLSVLLSLILTALSGGLEPYAAFAATVAPRVRAAPAPAARAQLAPAALSIPKLAVPVAAPTVQPTMTPFQQTMVRLEAPSAVPTAAAASADAVGAAAAADFDQRIGLSGPAPVDDSVAAVESRAAAQLAKPTLPVRAKRSEPKKAASKTGERRLDAKRQARSPLFPAAVAAVLGTAGFALLGLDTAFIATSDDSGATAVGAAAVAVLAGAGLTALAAVVDAAIFAFAMWRGRGVTDERFHDFVRGEVLAGRLDGGVAQLIKVHRPQSKKDLDFGYAAGGRIYLRPELAATPILFRQVLLHELAHVNERKTRGPPKGRLAALVGGVASEVKARFAELGGVDKLKAVRIPVLERVLRQAQLSLNLGRPYDVLVVNAVSPELSDPSLYKALSRGAARVEKADTKRPEELLSKAENARRFSAVVLDRSFELLPQAGTKEALKLELALKQIDTLSALAARGQSAQSIDHPKYREISEKAAKLDRRNEKQVLNLERQLRSFWRELASTRLKDVQAAGIIDKLYAGLQNKGLAFLSFGPTEPGVMTWERLLRFWEAEDGGQFRVTRVDLENGAHVLVLRKVEARVGLWLKPQNGGRIERSVPNAWATEDGRKKARQALIDAGLQGHLEKLDNLDVEVKHVFGGDVARQEIYVTVPRRNATAMRGLATGMSVTIKRSEMFKTQSEGTPELHDAKPLWRMGVTGRGGDIMWIDTGADATHEDFVGRLDVVDMVGEGPEDWIGHGTHVAGISISNHDRYTGVAKEATGVMAKVFSRDSPGASDGDIMAAGAVGVQRGVHVINLSLGSRGSSADNLAVFFSELARNSKIFVTASQGNSGPFDGTGSQPAQGDGVFATGAGGLTAAGDRIVRFFSSVGPDVDRRYSVRRLRLKPDAIVNGGNVTTRPGSRDVYEHGVTASKSKDSPKGASDTEDGRHTRMSGTSMASPGLAAIAMLVMLLGLDTPFYKENKALVVRALLARASEDMGLPVWHQGAGWVTAWGAAKVVFGEAGVKMRRFFRGQAQSDPWQWVQRYQDVIALEDTVYAAAEVARSQAALPIADGEDSEQPVEDRVAALQAVQNEVMKQFNAAAQQAVPKLFDALKDPIWLVRRQAALALLNLRARSAALPLAEAALNDSDARVRQLAYLALAELDTHETDVLLKKAAAENVYAAYALSRHGDRSEVHRIVAAAKSQKLADRYSAIWLLGQLGRRSTPAEAEALSETVKNTSEEGEARHLAAASLFNIAGEAPAALSDKVVLDLLEASGLHNLALTRTISKVFPAAAQNRAFASRLREAPLHEPVKQWVLANRSAVTRPGALGELVALLAKVAGIPLDAPTQQPDPTGQGVPGADPTLGPVDLVVSVADGRKLDAAWLARFETELAYDLGHTLLVRAPEHKLFALTLNLRQEGHRVRLATPLFPAAKPAPNANGLTVSRDGMLVKVTAHSGVSETSVIEALLPFKGQPVVISLSAAPAGPAPALTRLINELILTGTGVVIPAGNLGPSPDSASPLTRGLGVMVGERAAHSGRGALSWTDDGEGLGTGLAAERTAAKLAALARRLQDGLGALPDGWFQLVTSLARRGLSPVEGNADEVGAGLYDKPENALALLEQRLKDPEALKRDAAALADQLRQRTVETRPEAQPSAWRRAKQKLGLQSFELEPAPESWAAGASLKELKRVLGDGTDGVGAFNFKLKNGRWFMARDAGLEGFLFSKLEVERDHGASIEQLNDYFNYLDALLAPAWAAPLRARLAELKAQDLPGYELNARLNALLTAAVKELRAEHASKDQAGWGRRNATYMIFARAYNRMKDGKTFFDSLDDAELLRIRDDLKANEIWPMGIFEIGELRRWGTGGGSLYSIKGYQIMESLGGEAAFRKLVERAHRLGLKVKVDYIPNHTSLDSRMIKERPTAFMHLVPPEHLSDEQVMKDLPREEHGEKYPFWYLVRADDGKRYLIHHPRTDYGEVMWVDLAQIDYSRPEAQDFQKAELKRLLVDLGVDSVRRDMAYEVVNARFYHRWKTILEKEMQAPQAPWVREATKRMLDGLLERGETAPEFLEVATDEVKAAKPTTVMIDEVYANLESVSRTGSDGLYDKIGLYDALVSRDAARIRGALRQSAYKRWQRGAAPYVNFIGTHDGGEGNPWDKFGRQAKAAAAAALMLRPILLYNGVETGAGQRDNVIGELEKSVDREKALPYDIPVKINWANEDVAKAAMLKAVLAAGAKHQELLDHGAMEVLEPTGHTPITVYTVGQGAGRPALFVASNWSDQASGGVFSFQRPVLKDFGAFTPNRNKRYQLKDLLSGATYERYGRELVDSGLYIHLPAGGAHIFEVTELDEAAPTLGPPSVSGAKQMAVRGLQGVEADGLPPVSSDKRKSRWDGVTSWLASKAGWVFTFLQVPQFLTNIVNLSEKYPALSPIAGLISDAPGKVQLISSLPWMGYSTGILANMLLLGYFASKKEGSGAFVQAIGVVTSSLVVTQIFLAGFMPPIAFAVVMPTILAGLGISWLAYKGRLPEKVGKAWDRLSSTAGLFVLPWAVLGTFVPAAPAWASLVIGAGLLAAGRKFNAVGAWTATALFMYGPIAQIMQNIAAPANMAGISVLTLLIGTAGNLLMLPRAMHTKDVIWFTGSAWGVVMGGWATMLCMYLAGYLGAALFWPVTLLIPAYLAFSYNMSRKK